MKSSRTLNLRAEKLAELTTAELDGVVAAGPAATLLGTCYLTRDVACMTMTSGC